MERDSNCISNRSILYNASKEDISDFIESMYLTQYKHTVDQIESKQAKLSEIREELDEFPVTQKNSVEYKNLQAFATRIDNNINKLNRDLSNLEQNVHVQRVLKREKQKLYEEAEQRGKEAIERYREQAAKRVEEVIKRNQEARAESLKNSKKREQPIEQPKQEEPKPKKSWIKNLFSKIIDFFTNEGNLDALWCIFYVFWFGFVGRIIIISDIHIVFKIIMIAGDLLLALYMFVQQHNNSTKE